MTNDELQAMALEVRRHLDPPDLALVCAMALKHGERFAQRLSLHGGESFTGQALAALWLRTARDMQGESS